MAVLIRRAMDPDTGIRPVSCGQPLVAPMELMRRLALFATLDDSQLSRLAASAQKWRYARGETATACGQVVTALGVVIHGRLRAESVNPMGRPLIRRILGAGDAFGDADLIDGRAASASLIADVETDVLLIDAAVVRAALPDAGTLPDALLRALARRIRDAEQRIDLLSMSAVPQRILQVLREQAIPGPDDCLVLQRRIRHAELAQMVGATRERVCRVMRDLHERGLLSLRADGVLTLCDG